MKLKKTLLVVFALVLMVCLSCITVFSATANDEIVFNASEIESSISESYSLNQEVGFPSSVTVNYKGTDYTATDGILQYPSGSSYTLGSHILDEAGKYAAKYFFEAEGGINVTASIEFNVRLTYFNFDLDDGSKVTTSATGGVAIDSKGNGNQDHDADFYTTKIGGLKVDIKEGNTFRVNVPINLNNINISELSSSSIVQFTHTGSSNSNTILPYFVQYGKDAFSLGSVDPLTGETIEDNTAIVTDFFAGSSSVLPIFKFNLPEGVEGKDFNIEVFGYNKAKSYIDVMKYNSNGDTKVTGDKTWTFSSCKSYATDYGKINYIKVVIRYNDNRVLTDQDRLNFTEWLNPYRTIFSKTAGAAIVRFTDAYDPSVFIELVADTTKEGWTRGRSNIHEERGFRKMSATSTHTSTNQRKIVYVGEQRYIAYLGEYGNPVVAYDKADTVYGRRVSFDVKTNRLYCQSMSGVNIAASRSDGDLITDFNNDGLYKDNHFKGFTTGEVFVSFYFENYVSSSSQIIIHGIGEYGVEDIISWENKPYVDDVEPYFETDFETTDNVGVYAALGDTVVIPDVTAWDVNKVGDMAINVYRNYTSQNKVKVSVNDGKFVVNSSDVYTIEYKQKDASGNIGIYTIPVVVTDNGVGKSIVLNTEKITTVNAGSNVQLPAYTVSTLNNIDAFNLKITAKSDKETINVDTKTMSFIPMYSGTYTLTYEFNDNFGYNTLSYDFESVSNDTSVIYKEVPSLPKYFIKGQKYNIEQAFAYIFEKGAPEKVNAEMYAIFDNSGRIKIEDPKHTEITGNETVYFVYSLNDVEYSTDIVPIVDVTYYKDGAPAGIDLYKYFVGNFNYDDWNETTNKRETNMVFYANPGEENMNLTFINSVNFNNFSFKYQIRDEYSFFNSITFKMTGVANPEQVLEAKVVRSNNGTTDSLSLFINGEFNRNLTGNWSETKAKTFSYSKNSNTLTVGGASFFYPCSFDGYLINFDVTLEDINGVAGIMVSNVCNQQFLGTTVKDNSAPLGNVETSQGEYVIGEQVTLNIPVFSDVLSTVNPDTIKFTVTDSEGNPAVSTDNVILNGVDNAGMGVQYTISFDKLTNYHVKYTAQDYAGNLFSMVYLIEVVDNEAPLITLTGVEAGKTYEVNKWGVFSFEYTVSDNISVLDYIYHTVILYEIDTNIWRADVDTNIQFYKAGSYRVEILAEDEAGNISSVTFYINAK